MVTDNCFYPFVAGNAFAVYPASPVKSVAIVTMVVDQLTAYGLFVHPLCIMWEKLWKIHYKPDWFRLPARIPIGMCVLLCVCCPNLFTPVCAHIRCRLLSFSA